MTVVEPGISASKGLDSAGVLVELLVLPMIVSVLSVPVGDLLLCPSLVPSPHGRREKWPGIHCLHMCKRFRKSFVN